MSDWVYVPHDTGHGVVGHVETSQGLVLAEVRTTSEIAGDHDEAHERGRVMAAAQEMLATLRNNVAMLIVLQEFLKSGSMTYAAAGLSRYIDESDAAIAKAKGETDE